MSEPRSSLAYRPDIDGLRAVAVVAVVLFHADVDAFAGGFVGVDVFFVVSGFLITTLIVRRKEHNTFSLSEFYESRARRLLPALLVVLAVTMAMGWFWMLPYEFDSLGRNTVATMLFGSNFTLWRETAYFAPAAEENPLLHTWSLGIEEQFYLLFPITLLLLARLSRKRLAAIFVAGIAASLALAQVAAPSVAAFYLLPTRAWELLVGSLIAMLLIERPQPESRVVAEVGASAGLALILVSVLVFDRLTATPSVWTLIPVGGTALVIACATPATVVGRLLGWRPLVACGLVSYSAYLWHQPLFAFVRLQSIGTPSPAAMVSAGVATFVLAWITWRFVERPFRDRDRVSRPQLLSVSLASVSLLVVGGLFATMSDGAPSRFSEAEGSWLTASPQERAEYVRAGFAQRLEAPLSEADPNLVIVGDSYARDFYNVVAESSAFGDHSVTTILVPARCQLYLGDQDIDDLVGATSFNPESCDTPRLGPEQLDLIRGADVTIIAAAWLDWSASRISETLGTLELTPEQRVFVIGSKSFQVSERQLLGLDPTELAATTVPPHQRVSSTSALLRSQLPADVFVDLERLLCGSASACPLFTPAGQPFSYDGGHLTVEGARRVGEIVFSEPPLSEYAQSATDG